MADEEQLRILKEEGVDAWNNWRENNPDVEIDLYSANLYRAHLKGARLIQANLNAAKLIEANLNAAHLNSAILTGAILKGAILTDAHLEDSYLQDAILEGAHLEDANLSTVKALATNFSSATLTGACIEDWNINSHTNLENVICDYIYLKQDKQERRPSDPNRNFEPGEFAKLVEEYTKTVDLIFKDGIDWRAFLSSYQDIQVQYGDQNVSIQAIEKKSDGAFVIRLNVPPDANKAEVESKAKQSYETKLQVLEAQYRAELKVDVGIIPFPDNIFLSLVGFILML